MSEFNPSAPAWKLPDPFKRVRYSHGLVLGVDEFEQEQSYFLGRAHLHNQLLHGYGTLTGLKVSAEGSRLLVAPGLAIDPLGRLIRVRPAQVADLDEWLRLEENRQLLPAAGGRCSLYVVLHYAEAETDSVPLTGPPGRGQEELLTPSRVTEACELRLESEAPIQVDEAATRRLGRLLGRIRVHSVAARLSPSEMEQLAREYLASPVPPATDTELPLTADQADAMARTACRIWVTEGRREEEAVAADSGVLLARADFTLDPDQKLHGLTVVEDDRPFVLSTRLLREWLQRQAAQRHVVIRHEEPPVPPSGPVRPVVMPFVTISPVLSMPQPTFDLWFHTPELHGEFHMEVYGEAESVAPGTVPIAVARLEAVGPNKYRTVLETTAVNRPHLRFVFVLSAMRLRDGSGTLLELLQREATSWLGYDGQRSVTAYCRHQPLQSPQYGIMAAGQVEEDGTARGFNLRAWRVSPGLYRLTFTGYRQGDLYVVKGTPLVHRDEPVHTFEVVQTDAEGILVRVGARTAAVAGFMVEIARVF